MERPKYWVEVDFASVKAFVPHRDVGDQQDVDLWWRSVWWWVLLMPDDEIVIVPLLLSHAWRASSYRLSLSTCSPLGCVKMRSPCIFFMVIIIMMRLMHVWDFMSYIWFLLHSGLLPHQGVVALVSHLHIVYHEYVMLNIENIWDIANISNIWNIANISNIANI